MQYLLRNPNFRFQRDNRNAPNRVLDYDITVPNNCSSFINNIPIRFKIYKKFIQAIESCSVRSNAGNHLPQNVCNPNL